MNILYLADIRFPLERANGVHTMQTCASLAERGHHVHLLVRSDTAVPARDPFEYYGVPRTSRLRVERVPVFGPPGLRRAGYLACMAVRLLARRRWDAVYTPNLLLASVALGLPARLRPPVVFESHNFSPAFARVAAVLETGARDAGARKLRRLERRERRVWRAAEGYVTTTRVLAGELHARFGSRQRVTTAPNAVRLDRLREYAAPRRDGPPVAAYAGSLHPYKGADLLIEALACLPEVHGLVIGGHPQEAADRARLNGLVRDRGLADRVTFTGLVPPADVLKLLSGADVLVLPLRDMPHTRYDSPMKLFEYLAAGRPIVASDLLSTREIFTDGETARLFEPGNAAVLADQVQAVLADRDAADRMGRAAFDAAATHTWARRAKRIERLLDEVVAEPAR